MNIDLLYDTLHKELGKRYGLSPTQVNTIRTMTIRDKKTRGEIVSWCRMKLTQSNKQRGHGKKHYEELIRFLTVSSWEEYKDITQKREF